MKARFLLTFLLFTSTITLFAQKDSLLIGKWKVIGSFDGNILHDFSSDSVMQFTTRNSKSPSDLLAYTRTTKGIYQNNSYEFATSGIYKHYLGSSLYFEGTYEINDVEQLIIASTTDSSGKVRKEMFRYTTDGTYLNLLIMDKKEPPFANTTFPLLFKLEKVK